MKTQQPVGKSWITDALIIALVTAGAYLLALYYEIGFCDYFNIPHYFISLNPSLILEVSVPVFVLSLLIVLGIIFVSMLIEYLSTSRMGIFSMLVFITFVYSIYFLIMMLNNKNNQVLHTICFLISLVVLMFIFLKPFTFRQNSSTNYWERLVENVVITEDSSILNRLLRLYSFNILVLCLVLFSVVLGIPFYYKAGRDSAMNQEDFLVVRPSPSSEDKLVILRSYGERFFAVRTIPTNSEKVLFEKKLFIFKMSDSVTTKTALSLEKVGKLSPLQQSPK